MEQVPGKADYEPEGSTQFGQMMDMVYQHVEFSSARASPMWHIYHSIHVSVARLHGAIPLAKVRDKINEFMGELISPVWRWCPEEYEEEDDEATYSEPWRNLVVCLNDTVDNHNPLIGREKELERTIQVLCRKEKTIPARGRTWRGKTAIVYGLAAGIVKGDVPERLRNCKIYQMEMGNACRNPIPGRLRETHQTGDGGHRKEGNAIVYIDEIHNMVGEDAAATGRWMHPTCWNHIWSRATSVSSVPPPAMNTTDISPVAVASCRFQQIDIQELSIDETINILKGLKKKYEQFHHVSYSADAIEFAVRASAKYVSDRFLPGQGHRPDWWGWRLPWNPSTDKKTQKVDKALIAEILAKVCKVDAVAMKEDDNTTLKTLETRIKAKIYGQDEAVKQVVESVQMAKAGLLDDNKPLASLFS